MSEWPSTVHFGSKVPQKKVKLAAVEDDDEDDDDDDDDEDSDDEEAEEKAPGTKTLLKNWDLQLLS
ncbi:hypothetical protein GH733_004802 [Mirounga leonina]|nr:hypothetical protein GH733_004802 [Mirounga leonina]